jgi:hypothetical protein
MLFYLTFFRRKVPRSPTARVRATSAISGLFSLLIRHKMLCPSGDKIMPVEAYCQDFVGIFFIPLYKLKSMSYKTFPTKCFKKR